MFCHGVLSRVLPLGEQLSKKLFRYQSSWTRGSSGSNDRRCRSDPMVFVAIEIPMPFSKATDPDTLIGLQMNGAPLPVDHGAPARMIVTGGIGTDRVKWVGWLTVSSGETRYFRNDESYVIDGQTVTQQNIKSKLWLPVPAELSLGPQVITGFARDAEDGIARVEWSVNDGPWKEVERTSPVTRWGGTEFPIKWHAK